MASKTVEAVLFPGIDVRVERVSNSSDVLVVETVSTARPGRCPDCRKRARRKHSSYQRTLDERPLGSRRVIVRLRVHRYFCDRKSCSRTTFVEQVPGLSTRYRRSSTGLVGWLRSIAIELGGRPAARLCRRLRLTAGRTRLLRLLTALAVPDRAPRVLGVDEFAFRKGCTYGTVLVDVEAGRVVDVLPDRTSETFAAWLTEHPGAEIICRDRATAYTKAVKEAAPNALEVADRWHLLQNLSAAVEKTCHQHRDCLRKRAEEETATEVPEAAPMLLAPAELPRTQIIERTRHRYEGIHRLLERRWTISAIARRLNLDRKTVRRFRDTDLDELLASARDRRPNGVLEPFKAYLNARFTEAQGQGSAAPDCSWRSRLAATAAAARSSANTSPPSARAPPNRSGPISLALARSPPGSCGPGRRLPAARTSASFRSGSPARTSPGPATSPGPSPIWCVTGADSCCWSGSARPNRTHRSRCRASPASSARTSTPSLPDSRCRGVPVLSKGT
nr:ISL3 family transposase [Streptomyces globisporus]